MYSSFLEQEFHPGKGKQMKKNLLHMFLSAAIKVRPCDLQKEFKVCHGVAVRAIAKAKVLKLTQEKIDSLTSSELHKLWYSKSNKELKKEQESLYLQPNFEFMQELLDKSHSNANTSSKRKTSYTKELIITNYYLSDENKKIAKERGLSLYSLSHVYKTWQQYAISIKGKEPTFARKYQFGQVAELDFNGPKIQYTDDNGNIKYATIMGIVLPASHKFEARAIKSQKLEDVLPAILDIFKSLGGTTKTLVVDNFKGAVQRPNKYEGELNETFELFCKQMNIEVVTSRPYTPTDKGCVEAHMKICSTQIIAKLNLKTELGQVNIKSFGEVAKFVKEECKQINSKKAKNEKFTRDELFAEERNYLNQPNSWEYKACEHRSVTVPKTGNIEINNHFYAVDSRWINEKVVIEIFSDVVKITHRGHLLVSYKRKDNKPGLSTKESYTPKSYLSYEIYGIEQQSLLLQWADHIGQNTKALCLSIFKRNGKIEDKNRKIVKLLSLCQADISNYAKFDAFIGDIVQSSKSSHNNIFSRILSEYKHTNTPECLYDDIYNKTNYQQILTSYMFDNTSFLVWSNTTNGTKNFPKKVFSFLNGTSSYEDRYVYIKSNLQIEGN